MMKQKLIRTLLLGIILGFHTQARADSYACLQVNKKTGSQVEYQVSDITKITFTSTSMVLHLSNGEQQQMMLSLLQNFTIGPGSSGIHLTGTDATSFELSDDRLVIDLAGEGGIITIFDATGKTVRTIQAKGGRTSIELGQLPKGVFLVKVNGTSRKMMNK